MQNVALWVLVFQSKEDGNSNYKMIMADRYSDNAMICLFDLARFFLFLLFLLKLHILFC